MANSSARKADTMNLTPIECHGGHRVKRDDLFSIAGQSGGKARACWTLASMRKTVGLITAGARQSPQIEIVAGISKNLGIRCRAHTSTGQYTPELEYAASLGAEIIQHRPGYNSVIIARAVGDAADNPDWTYIPFGMECLAARDATAAQCANIPRDTHRIVVPVGSGMSMAGIITGLDAMGNTQTQVVGIVVGAAPFARITRYIPLFSKREWSLIPSPIPYHKPAPVTRLGDLELDPIYEAKCLPYLQEGDLLWVVGKRRTIKA